MKYVLQLAMKILSGNLQALRTRKNKLVTRKKLILWRKYFCFSSQSKRDFCAVKMSKKDKLPSTTIINKYPTHRDEVIKACWKWLKGRRADDNAEGLWRVHDKLYDLTNFVDRHPGGKEWLVLTKVIKPL